MGPLRMGKALYIAGLIWSDLAGVCGGSAHCSPSSTAPD